MYFYFSENILFYGEYMIVHRFHKYPIYWHTKLKIVFLLVI
jgi:hypothetical protein